tara:strand:- start:257 stop:1924 length:1668 start_codon:yes stop_codon:yes gene_type:complete
MAQQPDSNDEKYLDVLRTTLSSSSFWSLISGVSGVFAVILGGAINLAFEELSDLSLWVLLGGIILIFLSLILSPRAIAIFLLGRKGRYGTNVALMTAAFFIILLIINYITYSSPNRIDVTATRVFTLSPQTIKVLEDLDRQTTDNPEGTKVTAHAFFVKSRNADTERQQVEDLLNEFSRRAENFSYRVIDPELNRSEALKFGVTEYPAIVFEAGDNNIQGVTNFNEQEFVTGILIATGTQQKTVYFLTGHGEAAITRDPMLSSVEDSGLDYAIEGMQRDNYFVIPLNLKQYGEVPKNAAALIIAGPEKDLDEEEYESVLSYVESGGKLILMLDPTPPTRFNQLLGLYGLGITNQRVSDAVSNVAGNSLTPMLQKANGQFLTSASNSIADKVSVTFFPDAGHILSAPPEEIDLRTHIVYSPMGVSTPASWLTEDTLETTFSGDEVVGQFVMASVLEATGQFDDMGPTHDLMKMVIFSDSDFVKNKYFYSNDNADIFLNSVNWLAEDYELISIRPKLIPYRELVVNSNERDFIKWSSWIIPPTFMIFIGFLVWWRRR